MANESAHLLVVDDNRMSRLLIARSLEQQGHRVAFADSGRRAMALLQIQRYDLILLDVDMPEMDGIQVLSRLIADAELRNMPIIMIANAEDITSVVKCIESGADDYIYRPINSVLLNARVNSTLEKKHLRDRQKELISKFATEEVADDVLSTGFSIGGKLVNATAMFSDIRSFTTITESQSPAETIDLLSDYYALMMDAIKNEHGVVNQMVGDGLMAIFGAPIPRDDHAERAVRAAIQMVNLIGQYNQEQRTTLKRMPLRIGIGIASGQVIAGYTGTQRRATYTCVGDTVNLAARLESHTKVVGKPILIDESTKQELSDRIQLEDVGTVELKGKAQPAHVYTVVNSK